MTDLLLAILKKFEDPAMAMAFMVIVGLFYLLLKREKTIATMTETIEELHEVINTNLSEGNATVAKLVTLVETLVFGRSRNGTV